MPDKSKFEREIDEIIENTDAYDSINIGATDKSRQASKPKAFEPFSGTTPKRSPSKKPSPSISLKPGNLTIAGMAILTFAAFTPVAQIPIALVGVGLFVIGYVLWFQSGTSQLEGSSSTTGGTGFFGRNRSPKKSESPTPEVTYWRGRRIEQNPKSSRSADSNDQGKIIDFRSSNDNDDK
jgi:hypothetical protein